MQAAAGINPPSPIVQGFGQLSTQHRIFSSLWKVPDLGLHFACVQRRGSISEGVLGLRFAVGHGSLFWMGWGKSPSPLAELTPVHLWLWLILQSPCPKTGEVFWEKQPGCVGEDISNQCFPPLPQTSSHHIQICGTVTLDGQGNFNCTLSSFSTSHAKPSLGLAE